MNIRTVLRVAPYALAGALMVTTLVSCYSLSRVPARYVTNEHPPIVFVRDAEGSVFSVTNPTIVKDSLVGTDDAGPVAVNLREVDAMAVRTLNTKKTLGFVGTAIGVVGLITVGAITATSAKDCIRVPNRNNMCIQDVPGCKYGGCSADTL